MLSIFRLASISEETGLPLSSLSDQVWSSGKFFCCGGSGFGGPRLPRFAVLWRGPSRRGQTQDSGRQSGGRQRLAHAFRHPEIRRPRPPWLAYSERLPAAQSGAWTTSLRFLWRGSRPLQNGRFFLSKRCGVHKEPQAASAAGRGASAISLNEDVTMLNYDFSPFYRSTVGFDRLLVDARQGRRRRAEHARLSALQHRADRRERVPDHARGRRLLREGAVGRDARGHADSARREGNKRQGREARRALPGHRRPRVRAPLPACRPRRGRPERRARTGSCTSTWSARCPRRRSRGPSRSTAADPPRRSRPRPPSRPPKAN